MPKNAVLRQKINPMLNDYDLISISCLGPTPEQRNKLIAPFP